MAPLTADMVAARLLQAASRRAGVIALGISIEQTEGARFWLRVMHELKNRGVAGIPITAAEALPQDDTFQKTDRS